MSWNQIYTEKSPSRSYRTMTKCCCRIGTTLDQSWLSVHASFIAVTKLDRSFVVRNSFSRLRTVLGLRAFKLLRSLGCGWGPTHVRW